MRNYRNLIDGVRVPHTVRTAECIQDIMNDAINDFPVDDLLKEAIYLQGEIDQDGYTAIVGGVVYEITVREGYPRKV